MEELLNAGAPVHLQSHDGLSPLRAAAVNRNEPVLKFLLEYLRKSGEELNLDEPDLDGVPLIHTLLVLRDASMVTTLLEYGASAKARDSHGRSCAHIVAQVIFRWFSKVRSLIFDFLSGIFCCVTFSKVPTKKSYSSSIQKVFSDIRKF